MKNTLLIILFFSLSSTCFSQKNTEMDLKSHFEKYGVDGCFVLYNQAENKYIRYNTSLCDSGYLPASTFKIPHSLIALEEGIVKDTSQTIKWDGHIWPNQSWNRDQTIKSAVKYSVVWVYTGFAEQISTDKYYEYVNAFDYGNKNLTGPTTRFWLGGQFRISANQQVGFLEKFYDYKLPVSKRSVDIVKDLIVIERSSSYTLRAKTGGAMLNGNEYIMWFVGYVVNDDKPCFFALNFKSDNFEKSGPARLEITKSILRELNLIN